MFHEISPAVRERMADLEAADAQDRRDHTSQERRLRQVPPETGKLLAILAASSPPGSVLEVGASGGYSGLWLIQACRARHDRLVTFEFLPEKAQRARETFQAAGVSDYVQLVEGDGRAFLADYKQVAFCFVDAEKEYYQACYDLVAPNLVPGGFFAADNAISHQEELGDFLKGVEADARVDALVAPVGKGLLICRKV